MWKSIPLPITLVVLCACGSETNIAGPPDQVVVDNARPLVTPVQVDSIVQVQVPKVDILWVVDNSCSMFGEQTAVSENFPVFMDYFLGSGLDYHIGVVSTDMNADDHSGKLRNVGGARWIDPNTPDPIGVFTSMAVMGTTGSGIEKGREAAYTALETRNNEDGGYNSGFLRDDAALHVIVVSDETDASNNVPIGIPEWINYLNGLRPEDDMVTISSIVSPPPPEFPCFDASSNGGYIEVTAGVGGIFWSVCDFNWSTALEMLGLNASGMKREFFLSQLPVVDTIEVAVIENGVTYKFEKYDELTMVGDWQYNASRNSISFIEYVPSALAEVQLTYDELSAADIE